MNLTRYQKDFYLVDLINIVKQNKHFFELVDKEIKQFNINTKNISKLHFKNRKILINTKSFNNRYLHTHNSKIIDYFSSSFLIEKKKYNIYKTIEDIVNITPNNIDKIYTYIYLFIDPLFKQHLDKEQFNYFMSKYVFTILNISPQIYYYYFKFGLNYTQKQNIYIPIYSKKELEDNNLISIPLYYSIELNKIIEKTKKEDKRYNNLFNTLLDIKEFLPIGLRENINKTLKLEKSNIDIVQNNFQKVIYINSLPKKYSKAFFEREIVRLTSNLMREDKNISIFYIVSAWIEKYGLEELVFNTKYFIEFIKNKLLSSLNFSKDQKDFSFFCPNVEYCIYQAALLNMKLPLNKDIKVESFLRKV